LQPRTRRRRRYRNAVCALLAGAAVAVVAGLGGFPIRGWTLTTPGAVGTVPVDGTPPSGAIAGTSDGVDVRDVG